MFWNKNKSSNTVVWRDKNGKIACPGNTCLKECDKSCPIWLNTQGLQFAFQNRFDEAISFLKEALIIAPDFVDAQNNLGTAYGMANRHKEAYDAFTKTLAMRKESPKAIFGLIISEMNLGMYEEALKHCDAYEAMGGENMDSHREEIRRRIRGQNTKGMYLDIATELLEKGRNAGYIQSEGLVHIPEVMVRADEVCRKVFFAMREYCKQDPNANLLSLTLAWSAYAGIGAVYHWHVDWDGLSRDGIYETLVAPRGVDEMDEYVFDSIGIPYNSKEGNDLAVFIYTLISPCITRVFDQPEEERLNVLLQCAKAMYIFGMIFEMNRLGMR